MMKSKIALTSLLICLSWGLKAQSSVTVPKTNLADIKLQADNYYDNLKRSQRIPDSVFNHEGGPYANYQRFLSEWSPRLAGHGDFEKYFDNEKIYERFYSKSRAAYCSNGNDWWEIGPYETPQGTMTSNGGSHTGAGPVHFLEIHPVENNIMLTGSRSGGLFYTSNSGVTWQNAGSDTQWDKSGCAYAAFNKGDITKWYAISNGWNPFMGWSGGVYRTSNSGANWSKVGDANTFGVWNRAFKIIVDPGSGDKACVITMNGLFTTSNLNASSVVWTPYLSRKFPDKWISDIELRPGTTSELYATVGNSTIPVGNHVLPTDFEIWKSLDFGLNWTLVSGVPATFYPGIGLTLEFNQQNSDKLYVLNNRNLGGCTAIYGGSCANNDELWNCDLGSSTWTLMDSDWDILHGGGHGFGVANDNSQEIIYGSHVDRYRVYDNGTVSLYNTSNANKSQYHVDIEDFVPHPENVDEVWMACHGGVYKSNDRGQNWIARSTGLGVAEPLGFAASYTDPGYLLAGLYHDGSIQTQNGYYNNWAPTWYLKGEGDGQTALIDNLDENHMYISSQGGSWRRSVNAGASYSYVPSVGGNWGTHGTLNKVEPSTFYRATGNSGNVARSFDRGNTNQIVSDFNTLLGSSAYNVAKVINGYGNKDYLYTMLILPAGNGLAVNKDINNPSVTTTINSWINLPLPTSILNSCSGTTTFNFNNLFVDHDNPDIVYLSVSSSESCNGTLATGENMVIKADYTNPTSPVFTDLTYDLPNNSVGTIVRERGTDGGMYAATDWGIFYTNNKRIAAGTSPVWCKFGPNLPHTEIGLMEINYTINKIRVACMGRGIWENDLVCPEDYDLVESGTHIDEYLEAENSIVSTATVPVGKSVTYRAGNFIKLMPGFRAVDGSDFHAFIHPCNHGGNSFFKTAQEELLIEASTEVAKVEKEAWVYPNPNGGSFMLEMSENVDLEALEIQIFNLSGKMVYLNKTINSSKVAINLEDLPRGLYLVRLNSPKLQTTLRVVVK